MSDLTFFWTMGLVVVSALYGFFVFLRERELTKKLGEEFQELNQDAGDIKRRLTWVKKREKKTLKKVNIHASRK